MNARRRINLRLLIPVALVVLGLIAVALAARGSSSFSSGNGTPGTVPPTPAGQVHGKVTGAVKRLNGHTWEFRYVVHNTGKVPISGFQLNSGRSNLFRISAQPSWPYYGSGVCGTSSASFLIYWSTGTKSGMELGPNQTARFGFQVNTAGTKLALYALSWGSAAPQFAHIAAPAPSSLPANVACRR
jgi:hypothetical protein